MPQLIQTERTDERLTELLREIVNARVWGGLHWRQSIRHGEQIGRKVAAWVLARAFAPID